jgi:excisionase family DNA binding protein
VVRELKVVTDDFITVPEAAKQLGKPKMTLYRWIAANRLIAITFGGILFVPKSEIVRLKEKTTTGSNSK